MENQIKRWNEVPSLRVLEKPGPGTEGIAAPSRHEVPGLCGDSLWSAFGDALESRDHQLAGELMLLALDELKAAFDEVHAAFGEVRIP